MQIFFPGFSPKIDSMGLGWDNELAVYHPQVDGAGGPLVHTL